MSNRTRPISMAHNHEKKSSVCDAVRRAFNSSRGFAGILTIVIPAVIIIIIGLVIWHDHTVRTRHKDFRNFMEQGTASYKAGNFDAAEDSAQKAIKMSPNDGDAKRLLADTCLRKVGVFYKHQRYADAKSYLEKATAIGTKAPEAEKWDNLLGKKLKIEELCSMGNQYFNSRDFKSAFRSYSEALRLEPRNKALIKNLKKAKQGNEFLKLLNTSKKALADKQFARAEEAISRALIIAPNDREAREIRTKARISIALGHLREGEYAKAYHLSLRLVKELPANKEAQEINITSKTKWMEALISDGDAFFRAKRLDAAKRCIDRAISLDPVNIKAREEMEKIEKKIAARDEKKKEGDDYRSAGKFDKAIGCYKEALSMDPGNQSLNRAIAVAQETQRGIEAVYRETLSYSEPALDAGGGSYPKSNPRARRASSGGSCKIDFRAAIRENSRKHGNTTLGAAMLGAGNCMNCHKNINDLTAKLKRAKP